ncbi:MAG: hypothetical protein WA667_30420 [Candidatus Nitrosopolaris sp.]
MINEETEKVVANISVDKPGSMALNPITQTLYVASEGSGGDMYVIDYSFPSENKFIYTSTKFTVGAPGDVAVNPKTNIMVIVINGSTNTEVTNITDVNMSLGYISVNPNTDKVYVSSPSTNTVSVIDGKTDRIVKTINLDPGLSLIAVDPITNIVYVTNYQSRIVYVIDGKTDSVTAGVIFRVNTPASGDIVCNGKKISTMII